MDNSEIGNIHPYRDVPQEGAFKWSVMNVIVLPALFLLKFGLTASFVALVVTFGCSLLPYAGFDKQVEQNSLARCEQNLTIIAQGLEDYRRTHGQYPQNQHQLVPDHIAEIPTCPSSGRAGYRTDFALVKDGPEGRQSYTVFCADNQHHQIAAPTRPQREGPS